MRSGRTCQAALTGRAQTPQSSLPHGAERPTTRVPSHTFHRDQVRSTILPTPPGSLVRWAHAAAGHALVATQCQM